MIVRVFIPAWLSTHVSLQAEKMLGDETMFSISSSHLLYGLREEGEGEEKKEVRLPQAVTTPRRGPLVLRVSRRSGKEASNHNICPQPPRQGHGMFLLTKKPKSSLTRFPMVMVQRPLQQIEEELGQLSCAALKENIQCMPVSSSPLLSSPHPPSSSPFLLIVLFPFIASLSPSLSLLWPEERRRERGKQPSPFSPLPPLQNTACVLCLSDL